MTTARMYEPKRVTACCAWCCVADGTRSVLTFDVPVASSAFVETAASVNLCWPLRRCNKTRSWHQLAGVGIPNVPLRAATITGPVASIRWRTDGRTDGRTPSAGDPNVGDCQTAKTCSCPAIRWMRAAALVVATCHYRSRRRLVHADSRRALHAGCLNYAFIPSKPPKDLTLKRTGWHKRRTAA